MLDSNKLEKVRERGGKTIARCPACAESGADSKCEHLFIGKDGHFGCVQNQGEDGKEHRKRIFALAGIPDNRPPRGSTPRATRNKNGATWGTLEEAVAAIERGLSMKATRRDLYHDHNGEEHFVVVRFDNAGEKDYRPFYRNGDGWVAKDPPGALSLFQLPALIARPGERVYVVEGEKSAETLGTLGVLVTTSAHGSKSAPKTNWEHLAGRDVVILPDNDGDGKKYAETVAAILMQLSPAASVRVVELPGLPPKGDCVEWLDARDGHEPADILAELETLIQQAQPYAGAEAAPRNGAIPADDISERLNSSLPKVELPCDGRLLSKFAVELGDALHLHGIYERGGLAFIINRNRDGLEVITPQMLRTLAEEYLVCFRVRRAGEGEISLDRTMSEGDAKGVLCAQQFLTRLPKLEKIATARMPAMGAGGLVRLLPCGYDRETLTLTVPGCAYVETMPLVEARRVIDELLSEFPFADAGRSKAVAVSAMVGLYAAGLLPQAALRPVTVYLANAEGSGKTTLAKIAIAPVHGLPKTDGDLKDKTETAKELLTAVIEARPYILFDNCKKHVDSPALEGFVTAPVWSGRVLGVSKSFSGPNNVTVFITGNGATVSPDLRRRSLFVELFMEDERAEDRKFRCILDDATLLQMRPRILAALWAFVREWDAAGKPKPRRTHSSFPRWAEIVGGIVEFAGYGCPLETEEIKSAADTDGADIRELVSMLTAEPVKFDDLVAKAREHGLFERIIHADGELKAPEKSTFGKLLTRYNRRIFSGGRRFLVDGKGHSRCFRVITEGVAGVHGQHGQQGVSARREEDPFP